MDGSTYGLSAELLASATGAHIDTVRRWKRNGVIPKHFRAIVALRLNGDLGQLTQNWEGFSLRNGTLWTPEQSPVTPGDIRAIPYSKQLIRELQQALAQPVQHRLL